MRCHALCHVMCCSVKQAESGGEPFGFQELLCYWPNPGISCFMDSLPFLMASPPVGDKEAS